MGSRVRTMLVGTAGVVFAVVGFYLSVLAIALAMVVPVRRLKPPVEHVSPPRVINLPLKPRESLRHLSSSNSTTESSRPSTPKNIDSDDTSKVSIASHFRSESSSSFRQHEQVDHAEEFLYALPKPRPMGNLPRQDNSTTPPTTSCQTPCASGSRQRFRLRKLKPIWGEKRLDNQTTIHRCLSSPVLTSPVDPPSPTKQKTSVLVKKKSSKNLRKIASVPSGLGPKSRPLEKKKSQPLRTRPYEAPYFFPPPIPVEKMSSRAKLPRSHTFPPQRLTSPVPPLPVKAVTIGGSST